MKNYYITTPIYYPSGKLHLGHVYSTVAADTIKRIKQQEGYNVCFLTGTDEHGEKIEQKAIAQGLSPQEYVDKMSKEIQKLWNCLDVDYDIFARTTDLHHTKQVQEIFKKLKDNGDIYLGSYEGDYCVSCETFVTPSQIKDKNHCPDCNGELTKLSEETYMFNCQKYVEKVKEMIKNDEILIRPESRKNELLNSFLNQGVPDLAISRTNFQWGIPVPDNSKHVVYVWLDALTNYINFLDKEEKNDFWPADVQIMGKEIIRFHAIYWPMILLALNKPMPKKLFAHGWLLMNGEKMSKSKKNVIYPEFLVENYGSDAVRYFLLREIPFGNDGIFTPSNFIKRYNSDLVNELSNLVNRSIAMANKYFNGSVKNTNVILKEIEDMDKIYNNLKVSRETLIENLEFSKDLELIWSFIHQTNKFIDLTEPWVLAKEENKREELESVIYALLDNVLRIGDLIYPYMPNTGTKIKEMINKKSNEITVPTKPEILYTRLDEEKEIEKILSNME